MPILAVDVGLGLGLAGALLTAGYLLGKRSRREQNVKATTLHPAPVPPPFPEAFAVQARFAEVRSPVTSDTRKPHAEQDLELPNIQDIQDLQARLNHTSTTAALMEAGLSWASELTRSSVLFFRYQSSREIAILERVVGFGAPGGMGDALILGGLKFSFPRTIETALLELANHFKPASMHRYEPLLQLMSQRLGVAFFEAWALAPLPHLQKTAPAFPHAKGVGFQAEIHGVIVILQSSTESALKRPILLQGMEILAHELALRPTPQPPTVSSLARRRLRHPAPSPGPSL